VLVARREDRLQTLAAELSREFGIVTHVIAQDLGEPGAAHALYARVQERGLHIDVLLNNAGLGKHGTFTSLPLETQMSMLRVNVDALTELTWLFGRDMVSRGKGSILLVSSIAGFLPVPQFATYAASKSYVLSFGKALHAEWKPHNVNVTVLCPGGPLTEFMDVAGQKIDGIRSLAMMGSDVVAGAGLSALARGRSVVVPGVLYKVSMAMLRLIPSRIQATLGELATR
jgi:short-subunit dehydrogenase